MTPIVDQPMIDDTTVVTTTTTTTDVDTKTNTDNTDMDQQTNNTDIDAQALTQALTQVKVKTVPLQINLKHGKHITLDVEPHETMASVKRKLYEKEGIAVSDKLTLLCSGVTIQNDHTVSDYKISGTIDEVDAPMTPTSSSSPSDETWRDSLTVGSQVDILDSMHHWYTGTIIADDHTPQGWLAVSYDGWGPEWNEYMEPSNVRLAPHMSKARGDRKAGGVTDKQIAFGHHCPKPTYIATSQQRVLPSAPKSPKQKVPSSPRARARSPARSRSRSRSPARSPKPITPVVVPVICQATTVSTLPRNTVYLHDVPIALTNADLTTMYNLLQTPVSSTTINTDNSGDAITLAHWCCVYDRVDVLTLLTARGMNSSFSICHTRSNIPAGTPMHVAARYGSESCIRYLLSQNIPYHVYTTLDRMLPLHYAMKQTCGGCTRVLMSCYEQDDSKHEDQYMENRMGETPLHMAVSVMSVDNITISCNSTLFPYLNRTNDVLQLPSYYRKYVSSSISHDVIDSMLELIQRTHNQHKKKRVTDKSESKQLDSDSDSETATHVAKKRRVTRSRSRSRSASPSMRDVKKTSISATSRELVTPPLSPGMSTRHTSDRSKTLDEHTTRSETVYQSRVTIRNGSSVTTIEASSQSKSSVDRALEKALKQHKKQSQKQRLVSTTTRVTRSTSRSPSPARTKMEVLKTPSSPASNTRLQQAQQGHQTRSRSRQ